MNDEILFQYLNNELTKKEMQSVEAWIEEYPDEFEKIKIIWENAAVNQSDFKPDLNNMWKNINTETHSTKDIKIWKLPCSKLLLKYAAIFILAIGLLGYFANERIHYAEWLEYTSTHDTTEDFVLPDGSKIMLNKASALYYKKKLFSSARETKLMGEAFFQVKKEPGKPFVIQVNNTIVKVLGTSFNINASDKAGNIMVSVKSGKVMFYKKADADNNLILTAGERGIFSSQEQKIYKSKVENQNYLAWKTGVILFKNNTLTEVCEVLNNYYDTTIVIGHPALKTKKLTARYQNKSLPEVLELLKITLDINYRHMDDKITLISQ